jgi:regulator of RNase E activity RraB
MSDDAENSEVADFADRWLLYYSRSDDGLYRIAVDIGLRAPDPRLPHLSRLTVPLKSEGCLFTREEGTMLDALIDRLEAPPPPTLVGRLFAEKPNEVVFVGRATVGGVCNLYFYSEHEIPKRHFVALERAAPGQPFNAASTEDPDWVHYFRELHPGSALTPLLTSHAQLELRREDGDRMTIARDVDHTLAFRDAASRSAFLAEIKSNWRERLYEVEGPQERRFLVDLTRSHDVTASTTDQYIVSLASYADEHDGVYDGWGARVVLPEKALPDDGQTSQESP